MTARRWFAAAFVGISGIVAACVGEDPDTTSPPGGADGGATDAPNMPDAPAADAGADASGDPKNCGAPGHDCFGGECVGDVCQPVVIAQSQLRPLAIAVDATHVYWVNGGSLNIQGNACDPTLTDGSIVRAKHDGSELVRLADGLECPTAIALGPDDHVYFATTGGTANAGTISKVSKTVTSTTKPTTVYGSLPVVHSLLFDGTTLYWSDEGQGGRVVRGSTDATTASVFAQGQATLTRHLRSEGQSIYWTTGYVSPQGVFRGAPKTSDVDGGLDGGSTVLAGPYRYLAAMTTTATHAYLAYGGDGQPEVLEGYTLASGTRTQLFETSGGGWRGLAADATHVYAASRYQCLTRIDLASAKGSRFVTIGDFCTAVAVDPTSVFVTSTEAGKVRRIRKPAR